MIADLKSRTKAGMDKAGRLAEKADQNLDLLELIYAAIALGFFAARYRWLADTAGKLWYGIQEHIRP